MHLLRSRSFNYVDQPSIVVDVTSTHEAEGASLIEYFESEIKDGHKYCVGEAIDMGWGRLKLILDESGDLVVHEPSFKEMPIKWVRGIENTYNHLMLQRKICNEIGVVPDFSSLMQAAVFSEYMLDHKVAFRMDRHAGNGQGNSGWAIYEEWKIDAKNVKFVSLFQISIIYPQMIPFFALPVGVSVIYKKDIIEINFNNETINSSSNDFLSRLLTSNNYGRTNFSS